MDKVFRKERLYLLILFLVSISACKSGKTTTQGIKGQVYWVEGNRMPLASEDGKTSDPPKQGVKRVIKIHELTHINEARLGDYLFGEIETPLVTEIETDDSGQFEIELPKGKYSLFTVEENGYFANVFDLDSYINPVVVEEKSWTQVEIIIDYEAAY